ncbi:ATP-binding protein [Beijerinckia mobilis]|uniref:ATP-binding protein n=1 Tax=Beijerinckia mobilis TaxID=231434 RepID=UPI00054EE93C|nr:YhaN family protein [Beijerinckia mobilis]
MRFVSLSLERYGPFSEQQKTDRLLTFREDAKLHVVYGRNEAGKSSTLAAIGDLLFGIPARNSPYAFDQRAKDLRLGATLLARDGSRLSFRRKPGNKNALSDAEGAVLPDDALAPYLGGLSRAVFDHAFGLNAERLRASATDLAGTEGDVGASLLAAASGLRGLVSLRQTLDEEADQLYGTRKAGHRLFYQALDRYNAASAAIRSDELRADDWKSLNAEISELGAELDNLRQEREGLAREEARLARLKRVAPLLDAIDGRLRQIEAQGVLPEADPRLLQELGEALGKAASLDSKLAELAEAYERAGREIAAILVDEALLARAESVSGLFARTENYAKILTDLPRVAGDMESCDAELRQCAARLRPSDDEDFAGGTDLAQHQPGDAAIARVERLITLGQKAAIEARAHEETLAADEEKAAALAREQERFGACTDPAPLADRFGALASLPGAIARHRESQARIETETKVLHEAAARLRPPVASLDVLAAAMLPGSETLARFRTDFDALDADLRREKERKAEALAEGEAARRDLARLAGEGPVASREAIEKARAGRDEVWESLRRHLLGEALLAQESLVTVIAGFDRLRLHADLLADRAVGEAQRIADYQRLTRLCQETESRAEAAGERETGLLSRRDALTEEWRALWRPAGLEPLAPGEMQNFLAQIEALLRRRESLLAEQSAFAAAKVRLEAETGQLLSLAKALDLEEADREDPENLHGEIERVLRRRRESYDGARALAVSARDLGERIEALKAARARGEEQRRGFLQEWGAAMQAIGLRGEASFEEAEAALAIWAKVPPLLEKRDALARRVDGMKRDRKSFEEDAAALVQALATDLLDLPPHDAVRTLNKRLSAAQQAFSRREGGRETLTRLDAEIALAREGREAVELRLTYCADTLACARDELGALWQRLEERGRLSREIEEKRLQISDLAEGCGEEELRRDLAAIDRDRLDADREAVHRQTEQTISKTNEIYAEHAKRVERRQKLEGGDGEGAEIALQQRRNAEAEMAEAARAFLLRKIGARLIERTIERTREASQNPLLRRASALFSDLTAGEWTLIEQEFDEDDKPLLVGGKEGAGGAGLLRIGQMSEGTRDQFYLALRLAYLADYAERAEAAPFIGDDLFASFDDRRTGQGLRALAAIGDRVQPILFTHHAHVVEIARHYLGDALDVIQL